MATREFAEHGYSGARVDEIAERTRTTKRMLYYYFGSKEGLYTEVLEHAYAEIRAAEQTVDVEHLDPLSAIRRLAELTFDHHEAHPEFIRLVSIENIHRAEHMRASGRFADLNMPAIDRIARILERGRADGTFTRDADPRRRSHDHQRVLRLPRRQPPHLAHALQPRPTRPAHPRPLPRDARRHRRRLPHRLMRPEASRCHAERARFPPGAAWTCLGPSAARAALQLPNRLVTTLAEGHSPSANRACAPPPRRSACVRDQSYDDGSWPQQSSQSRIAASTLSRVQRRSIAPGWQALQYAYASPFPLRGCVYAPQPRQTPT